MCGIAGIIGTKNTTELRREIQDMTDKLAHRGPDGFGYLLTNGDKAQDTENSQITCFDHHQTLAFGHRRLSIVDLSSSAAQPMTDSSGRYWIVFNGEIYNHQELRKELESFGYIFHTDHSDTEVILNSYDKWGEECLHKFNGMWAFCIWDSKQNTFFFSRDRAGKKPLYFAEHNRCFYFASELGAIQSVGQIPQQLDHRSVYDYLSFMMVPAPRTMFQNIFKLPAGHYLLMKPGAPLDIKRYWTPLGHEDYFTHSERSIAEGLRQHLFEAAQLRMIADVEVGVLLSGGLDSSINLAALSKYANRQIKAFSVGFEDKGGYKNEFAYSRRVAKLFKADYHELTLSSQQFSSFFFDMVKFQGEPVADTANIPLYFLAKHAKESGISVLLGGEGSDELFVGYKHWAQARLVSKLENKKYLTALIRQLHSLPLFYKRRKHYFEWYQRILSDRTIFWGGTELRSTAQKVNILSAQFKETLHDYHSFKPFEKLYSEFRKKDCDYYDWMTAIDLQYRLPDLLLARLDRMLMAASVEGRNPFLDVNVIEYARRIPPHLKVKKGEEKYILKKAFEGILPDDIIYRKKDSFTVPLSTLFEDLKLKKEIISCIYEFNNRTKIFDQKYIDGISAATPSEFWNIGNLAVWYRQYC